MNSWFSRLIGDQPDGMKQVTFSPCPGVSGTMLLIPPAGWVGENCEEALGCTQARL